jgi:predicted  nucleic acid-binding Zn-ribbon protein
VKATPAEQNELLRIQALDTRLNQLQHTAKNLPQDAALKEIRPSADAARRLTVEIGGELDDARTEMGRIESDVKVVEARRTRDTERLTATSSVKDVEALEAELVALTKRRDDLEDIELTVMERIEGIEGRLATANGELSGLSERIDAIEADKAVEAGRVEREIAAASDDRAAIAATVSADLLALYEKQRARYGIGAALLVRGVSMGSNVKLNASDLAVVRAAADDDVVICPDSGCILIRNEESGL